jgi:hypothetical protein
MGIAPDFAAFAEDRRVFQLTLTFKVRPLQIHGRNIPGKHQDLLIRYMINAATRLEYQPCIDFGRGLTPTF